VYSDDEGQLKTEEVMDFSISNGFLRDKDIKSP
jgi:hypothetical protein